MIPGKKQPAAVRLILFLFCFTMFAAPLRAEEQYQFIVPVGEELSMGAVSSILKDLSAVLSDKFGISIAIQEMKYRQDEAMLDRVLDVFKKGDADFAFVFSQDYVEYLDTKDDTIQAFYTITLNNKKYSRICAYVRRGDSFQSFEELRGKRWGGNSLVPTNWMLHKKGYKQDLYSFFSEQHFLSRFKAERFLDALIDNEIDVFTLQANMADIALGSDKKYREALERLDCVDYDHNIIFVYRSGIPEYIIKKTKKILLNAHKDKRFVKFKFIFAAIKGHFVDYDPADMALTREIVKTAKKKGWYKQQDKLNKEVWTK